MTTAIETNKTQNDKTASAVTARHHWSVVIIRHGYVAREFYTFNIPIPNRFNIWSGTKSFTGTAWGLLL